MPGRQGLKRFRVPRDARRRTGSTPLSCTRLDAPIVLAHGLFGFDRIGVGRLTLAKYFRGLPDYLRAGGNRVLVTQVPPIAGIERRARALGDQISGRSRGSRST